MFQLPRMSMKAKHSSTSLMTVTVQLRWRPKNHVVWRPKVKLQPQEMCSFMQRQVQVSLSFKFKWLQSFVDVCQVLWGVYWWNVAVQRKCQSDWPGPGHSCCHGRFQGFNSCDTHGNVFQHFNSFATGWLLGCFLLARNFWYCTHLVETVGFVIRRSAVAGSVGQKNIQAGFVILCSSVIHTFRRNAFTDVSLLMSLM